jgi:hypothetical protein
MLRRVSCVRSCSSVSRSGQRYVALGHRDEVRRRRLLGVYAALADQHRRRAKRSRVRVTGASVSTWRIVLAQRLMSSSLSNCTR